MTGLLVCIVGLDAANKVYSSVPNKMANKLGSKTQGAYLRGPARLTFVA